MGLDSEEEGHFFGVTASGSRVADTMREARGSEHSDPGPYKVELPEGVTTADWGLERVRVQNPSIRSYLGCIRLLEEVLDSDYAILHCSPERLQKIWRQVGQVCRLMTSELLPTLHKDSVIPSLGDARRHAEASFRLQAETALTAIQRYDEAPRPEELPEVRKLLCVSMGHIYAFLRDTFGEIVAHDPRSRHDADYFLSKRFAQDIEESEWLYSSVYHLDQLLNGLEKACSAELESFLPRMRKERMMPPEAAWEQTGKVLDVLLEDLTPKLQEVLSLRGIRVNDMESVEAHASDISICCRSLVEVYAIGREVIEQLKSPSGPTIDEREQKVKDLIICHRVISGRMMELLTKLHSSLRDLAAHIADSKAGIEKRRALMLAKDLVEFRPGTHRPIRRNR